MSNANKDCVIQHFEELWNRGHVDRVGDFFSTDFTNFGQPVPDVHNIVKYIVSVWRTAFPDLHFDIDSVIGISFRRSKGPMCLRMERRSE